MKMAILFLTALVAYSQAPPASTSPSDANLVLIRFQVSQKKGQLVADLRPEEIEVREDGAAQKIGLFEGGTLSPRTVPTEVIFLFDCERSALSAGTLSPRVFHENLLDQQKNVSVSIYGFSGGMVRFAAHTRDEGALKKAMDSGLFVHPLGTYLLDHIRELADDAAKSGRAVRMLVVLSDGESDTGSSLSQASKRDQSDAAVRAAQGANMALYPVLLKQPFGSQASSGGSDSFARGGGSRGASGSSSDALRSIGDFTNLSSATGGDNFDALSGSNFLPGLIKSIAKLSQDDYVVGFELHSSGAVKRHKVEVVLRDKNRGKVVGGTRTLVH